MGPQPLVCNSILVVDDHSANLEILCQYLQDAGLQVRSVLDGGSALQQATTDPPDLILLDIMMPEMDGFTTCRRLKESPVTQQIPVIFMSALSDTIDKVKGLSLGAVDYITKPFQQEEVLARVTIHLRLRQLSQRLEQQNALLKEEIKKRRVAEAALQQANLELLRLASIDSLTQLANRRRFDEYLQQEVGRLARERGVLSLILCDIDNFKSFNDHYGHQAGDQCLQFVAQAIGRAIKRPADLVARYGGEEFAVVLPNTDLTGAMTIAKTIQLEIQALQIAHLKSLTAPYVTVSLGLYTTTIDPESSPETIIAAADEALYQAKDQGRNQMIAVAR